MTTKQAVDKLREVLNTDEGYRIGWIANIAVAYQDAVNNNPDKTVYEVSNIAAENFINLLCKDGE